MNKSEGKKFENEEQVYKILNLIFYALVGIPLLLFLYLYLQIKDRGNILSAPSEDLKAILLILIPTFCLINIALAYIIYRRQIQKVVHANELKVKLEGFYNASVLKYSFLAAASMVTIIGLLITAEMLYAVIYLIILMIYSINRPTPYRLRKDLKIRSFPSEKPQEERPKIFL
ncbi:hypothetical protein BH23BAC1_BH23BAC1_36250 [soil metagenome]